MTSWPLGAPEACWATEVVRLPPSATSMISPRWRGVRMASNTLMRFTEPGPRSVCVCTGSRVCQSLDHSDSRASALLAHSAHLELSDCGLTLCLRDGPREQLGSHHHAGLFIFQQPGVPCHASAKKPDSLVCALRAAWVSGCGTSCCTWHALGAHCKYHEIIRANAVHILFLCLVQSLDSSSVLVVLPYRHCAAVAHPYRCSATSLLHLWSGRC